MVHLNQVHLTISSNTLPSLDTQQEEQCSRTLLVTMRLRVLVTVEAVTHLEWLEDTTLLLWESKHSWRIKALKNLLLEVRMNSARLGIST